MFSFGTYLIGFGDIALVAVGAVLALAIEHGWGWVLAKYKAYRDRAKAKVTDVYSEVTSQVSAATADIRSAVSGIEARVSALEAAAKK